jgi:spermidine/putrescine transport system ATP-binding protein
MSAEVRIEAVSRRFDDVRALEDVSLAISAGRYAVLLGPSGSGKTTLLSIIGGFLSPTSGRVLIGGEDVTHIEPAKRPTTTVFQDYALFPHMTVAANVGFGLRMRGVAKAARAERVAEMLALVGLAETGMRRPHELSGGQRQRIALARALAVEPQVLLLDEPLGALDLKLRRQMQEELKAIQKRIGTTFIHVTHDQEEAMAIADEIVVMNAGRIEDLGPPERVYLRPATPFAARFMGESNAVAGTLLSRRGASVTVATAIGALTLPASAVSGAVGEGGDVLVVVRPEHLRAEKAGRGDVSFGAGIVEDVGFFGTHHRARLRHEGAPDLALLVNLPQAATVRVGERLDLSAGRTHLVVLAVQPS